MPRKRIAKNTVKWTEQQKLSALNILEQHDDNISQAAKSIGVSRQTLSKWKAELWEIYLEQKAYVQENVITNEAKELLNAGGTIEDLEKIRLINKSVIDYYGDPTHPERINSMKHSERIELFKQTAIYLYPKKGVAGTGGGDDDNNEGFWNNLMESFKKN